MLHDAHVAARGRQLRRRAYKAAWDRRAYQDDPNSPKAIRRRAWITENSRRRRARNPNRSREYPAIKQRAQSLREYLNTIKSRPCMDCGLTFPPCAMDFDHVRGEKLYAPGRVNIGRAKMEAEIAKCDVVCANCHRIRTHHRRLKVAFGSDRTE